MTQDKANKLFDSSRSYKSHTNIVVTVRAKEIDVIGADVMDPVIKKTRRLMLVAASKIQHIFGSYCLKRTLYKHAS